MTMESQTFPIGIEEEFFLVDRWTREVAENPPQTLITDCEVELGDQVSAEYLRCQIEINTRICTSLEEARREIAHLRGAVARNAWRHGLVPIAAATHPFARWTDQLLTDKRRYYEVEHELKAVGSRMAICGLHVHVGIDDDELRIRLMNGMRCFLPYLLALSTSSPFWQGRSTGLKSFRTAVNDSTPRKGIPERFGSWAEYAETVNMLVDTGVIEDTSKIWWDLRPSARFPTLELRIADACPLIDDSICIAALFRCLCRCLYRHRHDDRWFGNEPLLVINENRWRAARYGGDQGFIQCGGDGMVEFEAVLDVMLESIAEDAQHFDCVAEVEHARTIVQRGTSADRQIACYQKMLTRGRPPTKALKGIVDQLITETLFGTPEEFVVNNRIRERLALA